MSDTNLAPHELDRWVSWADVIGRCNSAAVSVLGSAKWGHTAIADCAADMVGKVAELAGIGRCRLCGGPSAYRVTLDSGVPGITATVPMCQRHGSRHLDRRLVTIEREAIQRRHVSFFRLKGIAKNWAESNGAAIERAHRYGAEVAEHSAPATLAEESVALDLASADFRPGKRGRYRAANIAADMLDLLDVDPTDPHAFGVFYAAVRERDGLTTEEIAAELETKPGTLRQHVNRLASKVPAPTLQWALESLCVNLHSDPPTPVALPSNFDASNRTGDEAGGWKDVARLKADAKIERTGKGGRRVTGASRWHSARTGTGTRILPGDRTPNRNVRKVDEHGRPMLTRRDADGTAHAYPTVTPADGSAVPTAPITRKPGAPTAPAWDGSTVAEWAQDMHPRSAARLASAARDQRTRAQSLSDLEKAERLAAVGIPAGF